MTVIGITGTDGKTTTANLLYHILKAEGIRAGMISTVNAVIGDQVLDTGFHVTTPDAPDLQRYLSMMVASGLTHVVLETTSHGITSKNASMPVNLISGLSPISRMNISTIMAAVLNAIGLQRRACSLV